MIQICDEKIPFHGIYHTDRTLTRESCWVMNREVHTVIYSGSNSNPLLRVNSTSPLGTGSKANNEWVDKRSLQHTRFYFSEYYGDLGCGSRLLDIHLVGENILWPEE